MTNIEWCDEVWNPTVGCSRVSAGCENCYAERFAHRGLAKSHRGLTVIRGGRPGWTGQVRLVPEALERPLRWTRKPRWVFVNSMSDLFHEQVPFEYIAAVFGVMLAADKHDFIVLTKRPRRVLQFLDWLEGASTNFRDRASAVTVFACAKLMKPVPAPDFPTWPPRNVILGVSVEDQKTADERVPLLAALPARVRAVSYEPAIGPARIDMSSVDWLIVGGESGPGARPCDWRWLEAAADDAEAAGVPCFVKQLGSHPVGPHLDWARMKPPGVDRRNAERIWWPPQLVHHRDHPDMGRWATREELESS